MTEDNEDQFHVFREALSVYEQRSAIYGDVWQRYGALNNLVRAATKIDRLMAIWYHTDHKPTASTGTLDDAIDALNYLVFFIRLAREGNVTGQPLIGRIMCQRCGTKLGTVLTALEGGEDELWLCDDCEAWFATTGRRHL